MTDYEDHRPANPALAAALRALDRALRHELARLPASVRANLAPLPSFARFEEDLVALLRKPVTNDGLPWPTTPCDLYILDGKKPVRCDNLLRWLRWFDENASACLVAATDVGPAHVRTLFVGTHQNLDGPPQVFETTAVGGKLDGMVRRYATWEQAEEGHRWVVEVAG